MSNVRQRELLENYKLFLRVALRKAIVTNREDPFNVPIDKGEFLDEMSLEHGIGDYALKRYFDKFVNVEIFREINENSSFSLSKAQKSVKTQKTEYFKLNPEKVREYAKRYGLSRMLPKEDQEESETKIKVQR